MSNLDWRLLIFGKKKCRIKSVEKKFFIYDGLFVYRFSILLQLAYKFIKYSFVKLKFEIK